MISVISFFTSSMPLMSSHLMKSGLPVSMVTSRAGERKLSLDATYSTSRRYLQQRTQAQAQAPSVAADLCQTCTCRRGRKHTCEHWRPRGHAMLTG